MIEKLTSPLLIGEYKRLIRILEKYKANERRVQGSMNAFWYQTDPLRGGPGWKYIEKDMKYFLALNVKEQSSEGIKEANKLIKALQDRLPPEDKNKK